MNQSNSLSPSEEEKEGEIARKFSTLHTQDMLIRLLGLWSLLSWEYIISFNFQRKSKESISIACVGSFVVMIPFLHLINFWR